MLLRRSLGSLLLAFAATLGAAAAGAQQSEDPVRAQARELGYAGVEKYQAGDYAGADERLARAFQLLPAPSLGLWSARALVKLGKLVEGAERYAQVIKLVIPSGSAPVQQKAQIDAERELALVSPRIPRVKFRVRGAPSSEVLLTVDGVLLPSPWSEQGQPINPGPHRVSARRGEQRTELVFDAVEGAVIDVPLDLAAGAPRIDQRDAGATDSSKSRTKETLAWVGLGVGGAGVLFGTIAGGLAFSKKESLEQSGNCPDLHCLPIEEDRVASYNSLRTLSTVGFVAGGVFAATGLALLVVARKPQKSGDRVAGREWVLSLRPTGPVLSGGF